MAIRFAERMTLTLHRPFVLLVATRSCYDPNGKGSHVGHVQYAVKLEVLVEGEVPTQRPATMTFTTQPNTPLVWRDSIDRYASYQNHYRGQCRRDQGRGNNHPKRRVRRHYRVGNTVGEERLPHATTVHPLSWRSLEVSV